MTSGLFELNLNDLVKGLVVAVIAAVLTYFTQPTLDLNTIDWAYLVRISLTTAMAYLGKNLISDSDGKVLGKI